MDLNAALLLVRTKYLEETKGDANGKSAERYSKACEDYPALMNIAHQLWARELFKGLP